MLSGYKKICFISLACQHMPNIKKCLFLLQHILLLCWASNKAAVVIDKTTSSYMFIEGTLITNIICIMYILYSLPCRLYVLSVTKDSK